MRDSGNGRVSGKVGGRVGGVLAIALNRRGDCNADTLVNSTDIIWLVNFIFKGGPAPTPTNQGNTDCVGGTSSADIIWLINFVFKGGAMPACP